MDVYTIYIYIYVFMYNNLYTCVHGVLFEPTRHILFCLLLLYIIFIIVVIVKSNIMHVECRYLRILM